VIEPFKIIDTDNFGDDYPDEKLIADNIQSWAHADAMCQALNAKFSGKRARRCYEIKPASYVLLPGFEP